MHQRIDYAFCLRCSLIYRHFECGILQPFFFFVVLTVLAVLALGRLLSATAAAAAAA